MSKYEKKNKSNQSQTAIVQTMLVNEESNKIDKKYEFPASFMKAKLHHRAVKFGFNPRKVKNNQNAMIKSQKQLGENFEQSKPKLCPCCNLPINTKKIPFSYHTTSVQNQIIQTRQGQKIVPFLLNSSTAMFFSFIKMSIIYLSLVFIIVDAYQLFINLSGSYCDRYRNECQKNFFGRISTYNVYDDTSMNGYVYTMDILCLLVVIGSIVFFILYRKVQYKIYDSIDAENQTQDDYTILVEDISILDYRSENAEVNKQTIQFDYEKELKRIFEEKINTWLSWIESQNGQFQQGTLEYDLSQKELLEKMKQKFKVRTISLCFDLSELQKVQQIREKLMEKEIQAHKDQLKSDISHQTSFNINDMGDIQNQIKQLNNIEVKLCKKFAEDNTPMFNITHFVGKAFVSFEYQHYREYLIQKYEQGSQQFNYGSERLQISRGTYPTDIFWENMKVTDSERTQKVLSSYLIVSMTIVFAVFALIGIDVLKTDNSKDGKDLDTDVIILNYALTIFASIITTIINYGIGYVTSSLTSYEKHMTRTNHITSLVLKLLISQFINSALVYYFVTVISSRPFMSSAGLVVQVSFLIVVSGFINILSNAVNVSYCMRKVKLWWKYRYITFKEKKDLSLPTFQIKLNKDYQLPVFDMATKYSYYLVQVYTCMFYNYLVPIGVPVTAIIFLIQYWIDKFQLFYLSSQYYEMNYFLNRTILKMFEGSLLVFTVGNLIFSIVIHNYYLNILNLISLGIALVYVGFITFASPGLERKVLFAKYQTFEGMSYSKALRLQKFGTTYWTQNPGTVFIKEVDINDPNKFMKQRTANEYFEQEQLQNYVQAAILPNQLNQLNESIDNNYLFNQDYNEDIFFDNDGLQHPQEIEQ